MMARAPALAELGGSNFSEAPRAGSRWPFAFALLLSGVGFFLIEHRPPTSAPDEPVASDVLESAAETGSLQRQAGFCLVAVLGIGLLVARSEHRFGGFNVPAIFFL